MTLTIESPTTGLQEVPLSWIRPSHLNPRRHFDPTALAELAESIKAHGLLEPIVVRELLPEKITIAKAENGFATIWPADTAAAAEDVITELIAAAVYDEEESSAWETEAADEDIVEAYRMAASNLGFRIEVDVAQETERIKRVRFVVREKGGYSIVAGERRYRAAKLAGLESVPVRNLGPIDDATALQLAIVENLQREDLDVIEEAEGYRQLNKIVGLKQSEIATAVKRSQPAIANRMRLLELPEEVREMIRRGELSPSHGVALARWAKWPKLASFIGKLAVESDWTSKRLEEDSLLQCWPVREAGVVKVLTESDIRVIGCQACPFGALTEQNNWKFCLNPEHFQEASAAREAELAQRAKVAEETEDTPTSDNPGLPKLSEMKYGTYESVRDNAPAGCTAACPCRGQAIDYNGRTHVAICLDPTRFEQLKRAATREKNKARRRDAAELRSRVLKEIDGLGAVGPAEIALLCHRAAVNSYSAPNSKTWEDAYTRHKVAGGRGSELDSIGAMVRKSGRLAAVKVSIETLLIDELARYSEDVTTPALSRWWLNAREHPESLFPREKGDETP